MATRGIESRSAGVAFAIAGAAVLAGFALGAFVSIAAFLLARYGPTGDNWSFRGNGALAAYALIPAFVAGGWTAAARHHRGRSWAIPGAAAAAVGVALAAVDAALLPVFGPGADQTAGPVVLLALASWVVIAPAAALVLTHGADKERPSIASSVGTGLAWVAGLAAGVVLLGFAFPAGS